MFLLLDFVLCQYEIDSSSKPCFEEEIIKCVVLEYVIYSPSLQMAAVFQIMCQYA